MGRMSELALERAELGHDDYGSPEPDDLEMMRMDAIQSLRRYWEAKQKQKRETNS